MTSDILTDPHLMHSAAIGFTASLLIPRLTEFKALPIGMGVTALSYYYMRTFGHSLPSLSSNSQTAF